MNESPAVTGKTEMHLPILQPVGFSMDFRHGYHVVVNEMVSAFPRVHARTAKSFFAEQSQSQIRTHLL